MTNPSMNCLSQGGTLDELARRECAIGFDLRFCRSVGISPDDRATETCDPTEAEFARHSTRSPIWARRLPSMT